MVWISLISYGGDIGQAWIIYRVCLGLIDDQRITNRWLTFDSYLYDADISRAQTVVAFAGIWLAIGLPSADRYFRRKLTCPTGPPKELKKQGEQDASSNGGYRLSFGYRLPSPPRTSPSVMDDPVEA